LFEARTWTALVVTGAGVGADGAFSEPQATPTPRHTVRSTRVDRRSEEEVAGMAVPAF
jgi:hypothetical protein